MLLIDGYNVLFALLPEIKDRGPGEEDRRRLVGLVDRHCARTGVRARIYFDPGTGGGGSGVPRLVGRVEVVHCRAGETADAAILGEVGRTADRTAYRVVSSDAEVVRGAVRRGFACVGAREFLEELGRGGGKRSPKEEGISDAEAEAWMRAMGLGGGDHETR